MYLKSTTGQRLKVLFALFEGGGCGVIGRMAKMEFDTVDMTVGLPGSDSESTDGLSCTGSTETRRRGAVG